MAKKAQMAVKFDRTQLWGYTALVIVTYITVFAGMFLALCEV